MAKEILVISTIERDNGSVDYNLLILFEINPVIEVGTTGQVHVPTPSDTLPWEAKEYNLVPGPVKTALDNGMALWKPYSVKKKVNQTEQEALQRIKQRYPGEKTRLIAELRSLYEKTGTWVNI